jgi:hypothetical protein
MEPERLTVGIDDQRSGLCPSERPGPNEQVPVVRGFVARRDCHPRRVKVGTRGERARLLRLAEPAQLDVGMCLDAGQDPERVAPADRERARGNSGSREELTP